MHENQQRFIKSLPGTLAVALAVASAGACSTADTAPVPVRTSVAIEAAAFSVGFAREDISTAKVIPMGGYGTYFGLPSATRTNGEGTHDPLFASAMAVRSQSGQGVVLVSLDVVGLSTASITRITDQARALLGAAADGLGFLITATHTHHSPDTMGLWGALPFFTGRNAKYMEAMEAKAAQAAAQAVLSAVSATLEVGTGSLANTTSDNPDPARVDDAFVVLAARSSNGTLLGTLTQWSAHPTILNADNNALSSDFVGPYRAFMEQTFGGIHVYINGTLGDVYVADDNGIVPDPFPQGDRDADVTDGYERIAYAGWTLFEQVSGALAVAEPLVDPTLDWMSTAVTVPIDNFLFELADSFNIIETEIDNGAVASALFWFRIGELQGASIPGEIFPSGSQVLRALLVDHGSAIQVIAGMGNDWLGYLMTPDEYDDPEFGYHRTLSPSREAQTVLLDAYQELLAP